MKARLPLAPTLAVAGVALVVSAAKVVSAADFESGFEPQGQEYRLTRVLRADQVHPMAALSATGGYLAWQDNATDGDGSGIGAVRLGSGLSATFEAFRVNAGGVGDQEKPSLALLDGGGVAFVWQSGNSIRARFLDADGVFTSPDDRVVNSHEGTPKVNPVVTPLKDGGALVFWASYGQDDAESIEASGGYRPLQGVFGQRLNAVAERVGTEFQVNQQIRFNQRNPAVARLSSGKVITVWVSERGQIGVFDGQLTDKVEGVEIMARMYGETGEPLGGEFLISEVGVIAASPSVCASGDGFVVAWCQGDKESRDIGFEILSRNFDASGQPTTAPVSVNSHWYGDQFAPSIASAGGKELVVWSSLGQDGDRDGVFGQYLAGGQKVGTEFRVNTTTISQQLHPRVVAQSSGGFLAVWSGFIGSPGDFELFGQRYAMTLLAAPTPVVSALSANRLSLAWTPVGGYEGVEYLIYTDGGAEPAVTSEHFWSSPATLQPASTHTFRLAYRLPGGVISPMSELAIGTTWGADENFNGLPDDWEERYWGPDKSAWPVPTEDSDGDGMSNRDEFLAGTDPRDSSQVLRTRVSQNSQGAILSWNTTAGQMYQVEESQDLKLWNPLGGARFARSATDQVPLEGPTEARYYRVIRLR